MPLPIAHSAAGYSLYLLGILPKKKHTELPKNKRFYLLFLCVFLANAPDLDFIPGFFAGKPNLYHHGISHSITSVILISFIIFLATHKLLKPIPAGKLFLLFLASALSHICLDYFSSDTSFPYGEPLFWPVTSEYFHSPLPLFREVRRSDGTNTGFILSIWNENNGWGALVETIFGGVLISIIFAFFSNVKIRKTILIVIALALSLIFYKIQIDSPPTVVATTIGFNPCRLKPETRRIKPLVTVSIRNGLVSNTLKP